MNSRRSLPGVPQGSGGRGGRGGRGRGAASRSAAIASTAALDVAAAPYRRLFDVSGCSWGLAPRPAFHHDGALPLRLAGSGLWALLLLLRLPHHPSTKWQN